MRVAAGVVERYQVVARGWVWRVAVPVVGLLVAWLVGWRLSRADTVLVVFCAWLPLALWCAFAPRIRSALAIAFGLLGLIGTVRWMLPGEPGDRSRAVVLSVLMWYVLPGALALLAAGMRSVRPSADPAPAWEWHPRPGVRSPGWLWRPQQQGRPTDPLRWQRFPMSDSPAPAPRVRWPTRISMAAAVLTFTLGCCCPAGGLVLFGTDAPAPSPAELLPLPPGMDATSGNAHDGPSSCDMTGHACWLSYRITGSPTESQADLNARLTQHLRVKGWRPMLPCRRLFVFGQQKDLKICVDLQNDPAPVGGRPTVDLTLTITDAYGE